MKKMLLLIMMLTTNLAHASVWDDLWYTSDQQAAKLLEQGKAQKAAELFKNREWSGVALYRSGKYPEAVEIWSQNETESNLYNRSLAYARLTDFDAAITDLKHVLKINPNNVKAQENLKILENAKDKQKKFQNQGQSVQNGSETTTKRTTKEQQKQQKGKTQQDKVKQQDVDERDTPQPSDENNGKGQSNDGQNAGNNNGPSKTSHEREQAKEQALRQIPDDPGGLLREKFQRDYRRRHEM